MLNRNPVGDGDSHLYDIEKDPGETTDLAAAPPHQLQQMLSKNHKHARLNGVLPVQKSFYVQRQVAINGLRARGPTLLIGLLLILTLRPFYLFGRRRRF